MLIEPKPENSLSRINTNMDAWTVRNVLGGIVHQQNERRLSNGAPMFFKRLACYGSMVDTGQPVEITGPTWELQSSDNEKDDNITATLDVLYNDMYGIYHDMNDLQNVLFDHSGTMLYCRLIDSLSLRAICDQSYYHHAFDLLVPLDRSQRLGCITKLTKPYWESFSGVVSVRIDQTWTDLEMVPLSDRSRVEYTDTSFTACVLRQDICITVRNYRFRTFRNEKARVQAMRIHASESPLLPRSSMYMLTDRNIPIDVIPGVSDMESLKRIGLDRDQTLEARKMDIKDRLLGASGLLSV